MQHLEQQINIGKVQAGGGFVQDVERAAGVAFTKLQRELDALSFTARQCGCSLAELDIAQANVQQRVQLARDGRDGLEELCRHFDCQVKDLRNVLAFVLHLKSFAVVAHAFADVARHIHIWQKVHLDLHHAIALAGFTTATSNVEAEASCAVASLTGGIHLSHQLADWRKEPGVGRRVAARRTANRRLVDIDDLVKVLDAFNGLMWRRFLMCAVERARYRGIQCVVDQRGFART